MSSARMIADCRYEPGKLDAVLEFLKRTRSELRMLRKARAWRDRICIYDVNGDWFEVTGIGYPDAEAVDVLQAVNAAFNRDTIHQPATTDCKTEDCKEFLTGRRYAWAADRVM